jgi:hypothetical protein
VKVAEVQHGAVHLGGGRGLKSTGQERVKQDWSQSRLNRGLVAPCSRMALWEVKAWLLSSALVLYLLISYKVKPQRVLRACMVLCY